MVAVAAYVNNLNLNLFLFFSNRPNGSDARNVKCFTSCLPMDIFHTEYFSHAAVVYNSKCKSFELEINWIIVVCLYCHEIFLDL